MREGDRSELTIPLAYITNVEHDPDQVGSWWHGGMSAIPSGPSS
ncbi:MAG TPA: hypothetical protein VH583_23400 [Vicinamibacterales bacterium]|jgi:hypothetical protein